MRALKSGSSVIRFVAAASAPMMLCGVPAGAASMIQEDAS
jgi:hypothetical protein